MMRGNVWVRGFVPSEGNKRHEFSVTAPEYWVDSGALGGKFPACYDGGGRLFFLYLKDHHNHFHITLQTPERRSIISNNNLLVETTIDDLAYDKLSDFNLVNSLQEQWAPIFKLNELQGGLTMFIPEMPPHIPQLDAPVMIAEATSVGQLYRNIGVCKLIENPPNPPTTAVNVFDPLGTVRLYFSWFEQKELGFKGNVTLLENAKYGELLSDDSGESSAWVYIPTDSKYTGLDSSVFLIETHGYKITLTYHFNLIGYVPSGSEEYDPYNDPKLCPNGEFWNISPDGCITPLKRTDLSSTLIWLKDTLGVDKLSISFDQLKTGALGEAADHAITLLSMWFILGINAFLIDHQTS